MVGLLTNIFEAITTVMFCSAFGDNEKTKKMPVYIMNVVVYVLLANLVANFVSYTLLNVVLLTLLNFLTSFVYNKNIKWDIIITIIVSVVFSVTEVITIFAVTSILNLSIQLAIEVIEYRIMGIILSKLFAFGIFKFIVVKYSKKIIGKMKTLYWILFCVLFFTNTLTVALIFIFQYHNSELIIYNKISVLCSFGLLYSTFFSLYLLENVSKQAELERKQEMTNQQLKSQTKYFKEILIAYDNLKKFRHDEKTHNLVIQSFFENGDCNGGLEYMKTLSGKLNVYGDIIKTGNIPLDAIINAKVSLANTKHINVITNIVVPDEIFVEPVDIGIIFGNALDNAIEACEKVSEEKREIKIDIFYGKNTFMCDIINSSPPDIKGFTETTKENKNEHGFGIDNIKSTISKYENSFSLTKKDDKVILSFALQKN